jgi:hypothetical protein
MLDTVAVIAHCGIVPLGPLGLILRPRLIRHMRWHPAVLVDIVIIKQASARVPMDLQAMRVNVWYVQTIVMNTGVAHRLVTGHGPPV